MTSTIPRCGRCPTIPAPRGSGSGGPGYRGEAIHFETTAGMIANDRLMAEAIAEMWEDVGVKVVLDVIDIEVRHRKNRQQAFKGLWWSDPTSIIRDPDGHDGAAPAARGSRTTTGATTSSTAWPSPRDPPRTSAPGPLPTGR